MHIIENTIVGATNVDSKESETTMPGCQFLDVAIKYIVYILHRVLITIAYVKEWYGNFI